MSLGLLSRLPWNRSARTVRRAVVRDARHAATVVLRRQHLALAVQGQAIGHPRGVGGQLRALRQAAPAHDTLVRNVAEEQVRRRATPALR